MRVKYRAPGLSPWGTIPYHAAGHCRGVFKLRKPISAAQLPTALLALFLVSGCAHQAPRSPEPAPAVPTPVAETPALVPDDTSVVPADAPPAAATSVIVPGPTPLTAAVTPDLLQHIRSGFQLVDVDQAMIDRELNWYANHPDYLERVWGRAELYLYYIVQQLDARGMPRELALLPVIESAFEPYAYSRARASGLWQFIEGTGRNYGLKTTWWYDGRRDVVESTRAALDYLQTLHDMFDGDWLLAIAAYNCGEMNVARAVARNNRAGLPTDFWHLKLPTETRAYVPKLLAMRRLVADPSSYGLEFSSIPDQAYFTPIDTGGQVNLQVIAELAGITTEDLYELNPAFHRPITDPTGPYSLLVPVDSADAVTAALNQLTPEQKLSIEHYSVARTDTVDSIAKHFNTNARLVRELNGMGLTERLDIGSDLRVPTSRVELPVKAAHAAELADNRRLGRYGRRRGQKPVVHIVKRGDSLWSIARRTGTDAQTLAKLNGLSTDSALKAGQRLLLSARSSTSSEPTVIPGTATGSGRQVTYVVRAGDTIYGIARFLQVTVAELLNWNGLSEHGAIKPGQKLTAFVASRS